MKLDFQWKPKTGIGLIADANGCQLAVLTAAGGAPRLFTRPSPATDDAENAAAPSQWLLGLKPDLGKGRFRLATAVHSCEVFSQRVSLPSTDPIEIGQMLSMQIEKWSPLPLEEVVWSHEILGIEGGSADVLLVFGKKEDLIRHATEWGEDFLPDLIDVDLMVLWRALRARQTFEGVRYGALLWIDTGARIVRCMLLKAGKPVLVQHLPLDDANPAAFPRAMSILLLTAEATFGIEKPDQVFVFAPGAAGAALGSQLESELGVPVRSIEASDDLSAAIGLASRALQNGTAEVNLLPMDFVQRQQKKIFRHQAKRVGLIILAGYVALLVLALAALGWRKHTIHRIDSELASLNPQFSEARRMGATPVPQTEIGRHPVGLEVLRAVTDVKPDNLSLSSFEYRQPRKGEANQFQGVKLNGVALDGKDVDTFVDQLKATGLFGEVKRPRINYVASGVSFTDVVCPFAGAPVQPPTSAGPARGRSK